MKDKLAFIDHSYHQKTGATQFLIDLLEEKYDVQLFWDQSWNGGPRIDLSFLAGSPINRILFFQLIHYPEQELRHLSDKEVFICPMYDASPVQFDSYWKKFLTLPKVKFINFSRTLHEKLDYLGFPSKYVQYFVPPQQAKNCIQDKEFRGLLWQRTNQITWKQIRKLIPEYPFQNFHLHSATDPPGYRLIKPSPKEFKQYNIKLSHWFTQQKDYLNLLDQVDIFFAPRFSEGIGMSFLEAMARGKCVVAPDRPTMNEYISHGRTGILYDPHKLEPIQLADIKRISMNAQAFSEEGHKNWLASKQEIIDFIVNPLPDPPRKKLFNRKTPWACKLEFFLFKLKEVIKKKFPHSQVLISWFRKLYR